MRVIVSATAPELTAIVDPRFGRAAWFVVVDSESMAWQAHANPAVSAPSGAGALAAQFVVQQGAQAVLSGDLGPNAYMALAAANVPMYRLDERCTVAEAVTDLASGKLEQLAGPTGPKHRGAGRASPGAAP